MDFRIRPWRRRPWSALRTFTIWVSLFASASWAKTAADYFIHSLPGQPSGPLLRMHAGLVEVVPEHHGNLFFWQFENRHLANKHRTVIWLNGGPGCSSLDGAMMEIGPYRLKDEQDLEYNDGSWDEFANLLFVDNPIGTGFSQVDGDSYQHELYEMADTFVVFLKKYFELFPEHEHDDIYIAGESYAGQHIPYVAKSILKHNDAPDAKIKWNLKGMLIGNAWIAPKEQSLAYLQYAYKYDLIKKGSDVANQLDAKQAICEQDLNKSVDKMRVSYPHCEDILTSLLRLTKKGDRCTNMYDVRLDDTFPSCGMNWPPDLKQMTPYLRRADVVKALHIDHDKTPGWTECNGQVGSNFRARNSAPAIDLLPELLEKGVPTLLFSGKEDLICNHMGTEELIHNMQWSGGTGFELAPGTWAPRRDWTFEGELAGIWQEARNLTYVLFYNASHMVPFDYPRRSRDMLDRFMRVDIASIGGQPADSRIDGQKGLETSVGGHPNSTAAEAAEQAKLDNERWSAYYRSGAIALVVVAVLALCFGWYVWRDRRRRAGYTGLMPVRDGRLMQRVLPHDVEAADFDENELEDIPRHNPDGRRYSVGGMSSDEEGDMGAQKAVNGKAPANGRAGRK